MTAESENQKRAAKKVENIFEALLWNSRLIVMIAVIFGLIGSLTLFIVGGLEILNTVQTAFGSPEGMHNYNEILIGIIGSIDLFLIGIVLMIFSFGVYELFISKIDIARLNKDIKKPPLSSTLYK